MAIRCENLSVWSVICLKVVASTQSTRRECARAIRHVHGGGARARNIDDCLISDQNCCSLFNLAADVILQYFVKMSPKFKIFRKNFFWQPKKASQFYKQVKLLRFQ